MRINFFNQSGSAMSGISNGITGTMTGPLILAADPVSPLEAATKRYVDTKVAALSASNLKSGTLAVSRFPAFTGDVTSATGTGVFALSNSGVTAGTYTKVTVNAKGRIVGSSVITNDDIPAFNWSKITSGKPTTLAGYGITDAVNVAGGVLAGLIKLNNDPTSGLHAANKQYADSAAALNTSIKPGDIVRRPAPTPQTGYLRANGSYVSKATYAALYSAVKKRDEITITMDHTSYAALGEGRPWANQSAFRTLDLTDLNSWYPGVALPAVRGAAKFIVTGRYVHCIGGYSDTSKNVTNVVYSAIINTDGSLGKWVQGNSLLVGVVGAAVFVTENIVYVCGGITNSAGTFSKAVQRATINGDGSLGTWSYSASGDMADLFAHGEAIVTKNRVYVFGGMINDSQTYSNKVHTASINSSGVVGTWSVSTTLPQNVGFGVACTVIKNNLYLLCKADNSASKAATIFKAPVNSDGTLGAWVTTGITIPFSPQHGSLVATKTHLYYIGGSSADDVSQSISTNQIYSIPVNTDGTLGAWSSGTTLPFKHARGDVILVKDKLHLMGGYIDNTITNRTFTTSVPGKEAIYDYTHFYDATINKFDGTNVSGDVLIQGEVDGNFTMPGNGKPWTQQNQINQVQSGDISGWVNGTALQVGSGWSNSALVTNTRAYIVGTAIDGARVSQIYAAPLLGDGTLGTWATVGNLPAGRCDAELVVTKNRVHLIGGTTDVPSNASPSAVNTVYTAPINADGTIGTWTEGTALPAAVNLSKAIVTKNRVYLISGSVSGVTSTNIYTAPINTDGTLGTWAASGTVPVGLNYACVAVVRNNVYLIGGLTKGLLEAGGVYSDVIYKAPINADGTLGSWTTSGTLPNGLMGATSFVTKNNVYLFGGQTAAGNVMSDKVWRAPINPDGSLGSWVSGTVLPAVRAQHFMVATSKYIYLLGGWPGSGYLASTVYAPIDGSVADYADYYNGIIEPTDAGKFYIPDYSTRESTSEYFFVKT